MNASGGVPGCAMIQRGKDIKKQASHENIMLLSYDHAKQYNNECSIHVYDDDGGCMVIYIGMTMEMP